MRSRLSELLLRDDSPLFAEVLASEGYSGGPGWVNLTTVGPEVQVRRTGLHIVAFGAMVFPATAGVMYYMGVAVNGVDPAASMTDPLTVPLQLTATGQVVPVMRATRLQLKRGDLLRCRYYSTVGAPSFTSRWLSVTPSAA